MRGHRTRSGFELTKGTPKLVAGPIEEPVLFLAVAVIHQQLRRRHQ